MISKMEITDEQIIDITELKDCNVVSKVKSYKPLFDKLEYPKFIIDLYSRCRDTQECDTGFEETHLY